MSDKKVPIKERSTNRRLKRSRNLLLGAGAVGALGYGAWQAGRTRFTSKVSGTHKLAGLSGPVEVVRDEWGVPHLWADNTDDLFFAQGFVQAQDRFWQMEFQRRLAAGRLAEIFGPLVLDADRFMRRIELYRQAEISHKWICEQEDPRPLDRFSDGVNAFIGLKKLPLELSLLRFEPEPWTPLDSLAWANVLAFGQSGNFVTELARAEVVRAVGPELAARLEPWPRPGAVLTVPPGNQYEGVDFSAILADYTKLAELLGTLRVGSGSNNWVVAGAKSTTGLPLLANDPHIGAQLPGTFYVMHLHAPDYEVIGASVPGLPGVTLGHNREIAWGVTNTMADTQDAFIERLDPQDARRYEYRGEWHTFESRWEEIRVKGGPTVRQEQFRSLHGPIVSEFQAGGTVAADGGSVQGAPVALAWSLYHRPLSLGGLLALNRASNWLEFRDALKNYPFPSLNYVYADRQGNIGYQYTGHVPVRGKGWGLLPSPGNTGEYDWTGFVPFEDLPGSFNPAEGFLFTANNKITGDDYPYHLGSDYANGVRAERILQLLRAKEKHSPDDLIAMMHDQLSLTGLRLARRLTSLRVTESLESRAQALLATWHGRLTPESVAGCIYEVTLGKLLRLVLEPQLGPAATDHYLGVTDNPLAPLTALYSLAGTHLLDALERDDPTLLPPGLTWEAALQKALSLATEWLRLTLGSDPKGWEWGKLHTMPYNHVLGVRSPLDRIFNRGPLEVGGDSDTIFQTAYAFKKDSFTANGGTPAWRMLADLADWDNSRFMGQGGQSGSPFSPHYADFLEPWLAGEMHPLLFSRAAIEGHTAGVLRLEPEPKS